MCTVFTIGHSNQSANTFDSLLAMYRIEQVVDVRTKPYSRFRHFNREPLKKRLVDRGIDYLFLGDLLGGHPESDELYFNGRVAYQRVAALPGFRRGIKQVVAASEEHRLALMCTEEDPAKCHRHPLLASALLERNLRVLHVRRDGSIQAADSMTEQTNLQLPLFEPVGEDRTWHSPKRIRRRDPNRNQT